MADYLADHCFNRSNYLTFDRRPVLIIEDTLALLEKNTRDELRDAFSAMRREVEDREFAGLFLVAVCPFDSVDYINLLQDVGYDAFTGGAYLHPLGRGYDENTQTVPYEDMVDRHLRLQIFFSRLAKSRPLRYFPSVAPGWNDAPIRGKEARVELNNSQELFEKMCWNALRYADESLPIILVDSWNAWDAGAVVEPDHERGFAFLDVLRKVYAVDAPPLERAVPDQNFIDRVSVLTMKDRHRPLTSRAGIPAPVTLAAATAEATPGLPFQWLFEEDPSGAVNGWMVDGQVKSGMSPDGIILNLRTPGRLTSPEFAVPVDHVREINLEFKADVEKGQESNYRLGRVFWRTTRYANFTEYDSSWFEFSEQGSWQKIRILPANLRSWDEARGFLIQLCFDFGDRPGRKINLRRVEVQ